MLNKEKKFEIKEMVENVVNRHKSNDPMKIIKDMNITIGDTHCFVKHESLSAIYDKKIVLFINSKLKSERYYYRLAHELGHIILHCVDCNHGYTYRRKSFNHNISDYEADYFANELLDYQEATA